MRFPILLSTLLVLGCSSQHEPIAKAPSEFAAVETALAQAVGSTPYSALVQQRAVERIAVQDENPYDGYSQERLTYEANVLQTFRGPKFRTVRYTVLAQRGAATAVSEVPFILTLCHLDGEFHAPEEGAQFPAQAELVEAAKTAAVKADRGQAHFSYCL